MNRSELSKKNFRRIAVINWLISMPLVMLFAWPYLYLCRFGGIDTIFAYPGSMLFSFPLMITILHGHVTTALGTAHRHHYYDWLNDQPLTYGLLFHPGIIRTRFRLGLLVFSLFAFAAGLLFS